MATSFHPSIPVLSPSFLYHPYIPSFKSKDFSFTCILSTTVLSDRDDHGLSPLLLYIWKISVSVSICGQSEI